MNSWSALFFASVAIFLGKLIVSAGELNKYGSKDDDYYEDFYLRKIPKLKVSPEKVKEFFQNHLSWFPVDDLHGIVSREAVPRTISPPRLYKSVNTAPEEKPKNSGIVASVKNFTAARLGNLTGLTGNSSKVVNYLEKSHIPGKMKNLTHPFRPRGNTNHTTMLKYMKTTSTMTSSPTPTELYPKRFGPVIITTPTCGPFGPTIRIHRKSPSASSHSRRARIPGKRSKKMKVYIDVDRINKAEKHSKPTTNGTEPNNSSTVTAEEMATDLAGRVTTLWKCVTGSRRTPQIRDVKYYLYTRRNIIEPEVLFVNYDLIKNKTSSAEKENVDCAELDAENIDDFLRVSDENREIIKSNYLSLRAPTKILIHGYTGSYKDTRMAKIKDAYLSSGRYNVIQVDWETLAAPPCYIRVTHHARFVGETVAKFIDGLYLIGLNMSLVHIVGFSLGAQVAGLAGNMIALGKICRITGLDPALPLFLHTESSGHLDKYDADFVDVIHTCGGILAMLDPVGHVDFYPNGGSRQPGCEFSNQSVSSKKRFTGQLCSSWEAYTSGACNSSSSTSFMGDPCSIKSEPGKYYLTTKSKEPFAG